MAHHKNDNDRHAGHELGHIVPFKIYLSVLIALLLLTIITVAVSRFDFGVLNIVVAMIVASIKALLVALFFMHLKYENPITKVYAFFPIFLLALLICGVFIDNPFRPDGFGPTFGHETADVRK